MQGVIQIVVYAANVNILDKNINTIKKNMDILIGTMKDIGLDLNIEENVCIHVLSSQCGENPNVNVVNKPCTNVAKI
jgi:hypothetical protein